MFIPQCADGVRLSMGVQLQVAGTRRAPRRHVELFYLVPLTPMGKSTAKSGANNGCLYNKYPRGEGLATSPGRRARLRFDSPFSV